MFKQRRGTYANLVRVPPHQRARYGCGRGFQPKEVSMPMIDVYVADDLLPPETDRQLGEALTLALLRAEGVPNPGPFHTENTAAYIHRMPQVAVQTAASPNARTVRIQVVTPPGALSR